MNRRSVIKHLSIVAGGILIMPSCLQDQRAGKASIKLNKISLDINQENLLADIAETLIPATDTPGAKKLNLHLFVMKMLDDCYEESDQQQFIIGLAEVDKLANSKFDAPFSKLAITQQQKLLLLLEKDKKDNTATAHFYKLMKSRTIQGYLNSKYVMTNLLKYELVPGRYNGYFPVKV